MEVENILAKRIDAAGQKASYDSYCRSLLANRQILAWILKTCVTEFCDCNIKDIEEKYIEGTPQVSEVAVHRDESAEFVDGVGKEDVTMNENTVTYDISFRVISPQDDKVIQMIINVESQKDFYPGYPLLKRGIYYCSRMISSQYGTEFVESHYEKLKKVYSIWVCTNPPQYRRNTITAYSMNEQNVVGKVTEQKENYEVLPEEKKKILKNEFDVAMTKTMEREVIEMCNLSQGIVDRTIIKDIMNLMDSLGLSEEESMKALKVPEEHRELYHMMLQEKMEVSQV